jgi:hypothetical protein
MIMCLLSACSVQSTPDEDVGGGQSPDGETSSRIECVGVLQKGSFYHNAKEEWMDFYYVDLGEEQYKKLAAAYQDMDFVQPPGSASELMQTASETQENPYEIQVISTDKSLDIAPFEGKSVRFSGSYFDAHTAYHERYIVFQIDEMIPEDR